MKVIVFLFIATTQIACSQISSSEGEDVVRDKIVENEPDEPVSLINANGMKLVNRINTPPGYTRVKVDLGSFGNYSRNLNLKPDGSKVKLYNGSLKWNQSAHAAIVDIDVGKRDLQQCADAVMRLRAEYLRQKGDDDRIAFNLTNGFRVPYSKWKNGGRVKVDGNKTWWVQSASRDTSWKQFRKYLNFVYTFAGTLSLSKELKPVNYSEMKIGDVLIQGGSPGHAITVMDMATNSKDEKIYLLSQSYMPAQEIHILNNPTDDAIGPWYKLDESDDVIETPEWTFYQRDMKRFD